MTEFFQTERFINDTFVTISNMAELLQNLQVEKNVEKICKENSLNIGFLKSLFIMKMRGYNNTKVAQKLGVHRITIQRYTTTLRKLKESEFNKIKNFIFGLKNERDD